MSHIIKNIPKKRLDYFMKSAIIIIDRGMDVQPRTGIALKKRIQAPYFDLRRVPVGGATTPSAGLVFEKGI